MGWPFFVGSPYEDPVRAREGLVCCAGGYSSGPPTVSSYFQSSGSSECLMFTSMWVILRGNPSTSTLYLSISLRVSSGTVVVL